MTEAEWLDSRQPLQMLTSVRGKASGRALRLFACAAGRRVVHVVPDPRCGRAVEVAERYADGAAGAEELREAAAGAARVAEEMARRMEAFFRGAGA